MKQKLRYRGIKQAITQTSKFIQAISLLEFLADPFAYTQMKKVKTKISADSALDKTDYHLKCDFIRKITSYEEENGENTGIRQNIIHQGKTFEEMKNTDERVKIFK